MTTLNINGFTVTCRPENAERYALELTKASKLKKRNPSRTADRRYYPKFEPGMTIEQYIARYSTINRSIVMINPCDYECANMYQPAAQLDFSIPEVVEWTED